MAKGNTMTDLMSAFNWDSVKDTAGANPFGEKKSYAKDERFYILPKNEKKEGIAIIRLMPDPEGKKFITVQKITTTINKNGQKRFVNEFSPATIGKPCPFQEKWAELYNNLDTREESKLYSRSLRHVVNIKVIKDPLKPENEGKFFLYEISSSLKDKFTAVMEPSETDLSLGTVPKQLFNPLKGHNIKLVAKVGANNQVNYDSTEIVSEITAIYSSPDEAVSDIKANAFNIQTEILDEDKFMSYSQLQDKLQWVTFAESNGNSTATVAQVTTSAPVQVTTSAPVQETKSAAQVDLDALLEGIM